MNEELGDVDEEDFDCDYDDDFEVWFQFDVCFDILMDFYDKIKGKCILCMVVDDFNMLASNILTNKLKL